MYRVKGQGIQEGDKFSLRMARFIVYKKGWVESVFVVGCVSSLITMFPINVNYDLTKYLPTSTRSCIGLDLVGDEFGYPGIARLMIEDMSPYEAKRCKGKPKAADGVDRILWCDSMVNICSGEGFIRQEDIKDYYKGGCAVMDITLDQEDVAKRASQAIDEMKAIIGGKGYYMGMAVQSKSLTENVKSEMNLIPTVAITMIFAVLCISAAAWSEPFLFLLVMGAAILLNRGASIFIGMASLLANNVATVLQLAASVDYSIFLLDVFSKEKQKGLSEEQITIGTIGVVINSILASSLTTVVGLLALVFMKFTIRFDVGLVLAKGIVFSFITVLFFMPTMVLKFSKWDDKVRRHPFLPSSRRLSEWVYRMRYASLIIILILALPAYVIQGMNDFLYGNSVVGVSEGTQVYRGNQVISQEPGRSNMILAMYPNTSAITEKAMSDEIEDLPYVRSVASMSNTLSEGIPEEFLSYPITSELHVKDYYRMLIYIRTKTKSEQAFRDTGEIRGILKRYYPENSYLVGETLLARDIKTIIMVDNSRVSLLPMLGMFLVVVFSFRSFAIPMIAMMLIEAAIFLSMAVLYLAGDVMMFMGYTTVGDIQLGATVDYSVLLTNNYVPYRKSLEKKKAYVQALMLSYSPILTLRTIIISAGCIIRSVSTTAAIGDLGHPIGQEALFSVTLMPTVLPAPLVLFDRIVTSNEWNHLQKYLRQRHEKHKALVKAGLGATVSKASALKRTDLEPAEVESDENEI